MADLDLALEAFNKAKAKGDTVNAKRFAQIALDLDKQTPVSLVDRALQLPPLNIPNTFTRDPSRPLPDASTRSVLRETVDVPIQLGKGVVSGVRFLSDTLGADNPLSQALSGTEEWLDSLLSAQSKRDQQEIARIMKEAEDKGMGAQVVAGLKALTVAPVDLVTNAFGTSVPVLVAGLLGGMAGLGARGVATGVGVLTGVGITKGSINDAVFQELTSMGVSEAEAKDAAKEAQAYGGENLDNIAFGGFLGALASRIGMEPKIFTSAIGRRLAGDVSEEGVKNATKLGLIKEASRTALREALPEALQGGHEQFASNIALQREGVDVPTFRGVTGAATLEGAVGAPVGAISSLGSDLIKPRGTKLNELEARLDTLVGEQEAEAKIKAEEEAQEEAEEARRQRIEDDRIERQAKRKQAEERYAERATERAEAAEQAKYLGALELWSDPDEQGTLAYEEAYEKLINEGVSEDAADEAALQVEEKAREDATKRQGWGVEDAETIRQFHKTYPNVGMTRREKDILDAADLDVDVDVEEDAVVTPEELGPEELKAFDTFIQKLKDGIEGTQEEETATKRFLNKASTEKGIKELNLNLTKTQEKSYLEQVKELTELITEADNAYDTVVRQALNNAGYESDNTNVAKFMNEARKVSEKERDEDTAVMFPLNLQKRIAKDFPKIAEKDLELQEIESVRKLRAERYKQVFKMKPGSPEIIQPGVKKGEQLDPSRKATRGAEAEAQEEMYERYDTKIPDIRRPSDKNIIKELQNTQVNKLPKGAAEASKYFREATLSGVAANPKISFIELAYDLANEDSSIVEGMLETTVVDDLLANPPAPIPQTRLPLTIDRKFLEEAVNESRKGPRSVSKAGLFRGEKPRTKEDIATVQKAANWVYLKSNFTPELKQSFLNLVTEFREEYKKDVAAAARARQATDRRERQRYAARLGIDDSTDPRIINIVDQRTPEKKKKAFEKLQKSLEEEVDKVVKEPKTQAEAKKQAEALEGESVDPDDPEVTAADSELTKQQATAKRKKINKEAKKIEDELQAEEREKINTAAHKFATKKMKERYKGKPLKDEPGNRTKEWNILYIAEKNRLLEAYEAALKARATARKLTPEQKIQLEKNIPGDVEAFKNTQRQEIAENLNLSIDDPAVEEELNKRITVQGTPNILPGTPQYTADANDKKRLARIIDPQKPQEIDPIIQEYAKTGNLNRTIEALLVSEPKEIRPVLRKLRTLAAGTKVRIESFADPEEVGRYYSEERVIALDPERGMNKATFFHELTHAGLDRLLDNRDSEEVKKLFDFYSSIKTQMGDAYGGSDLYEFVAELVGNSEFQNLLKKIKAPKSKSLWENIIDFILEALGIRKGQSAYDASFKFLNDVIEARPSIEPSRIERIFLADENPETVIKEAIDELPPFRARRIREAVETNTSKVQELAFGAFRLDNLKELYGKWLTGIGDIISATEKRQGEQEKVIEAINKKYNDFHILVNKYSPATKVMNKMAIDMRLARVDIFKPAPDPQKRADEVRKQVLDDGKSDKVADKAMKKAKEKEEQRLKAYNEGKATFEKLGKMEGGKAIQNMYKIMRYDFDKTYADYISTILNDIKNKKLREEVAQKFKENPPIPGYIPARRYGEFILVYKDKDTGKKTVRAFESFSQREEEIKTLGLTQRLDIQEKLDAAKTEKEYTELQTKKRDQLLGENEYFTLNSINDLARKTLPPEGFIADLMEAVRENGEVMGLDKLQQDKLARSVYEGYVDMFPESSLAQQFRSSDDVLGPSDDVLRVYGDTMVKWARKLVDIKYNGAIQQGFNQVRKEAADYGNRREKDKSPSDPSETTIKAAAQNISNTEDFVLNPSYHWLAAGATTGSYAWYMAGNISSGVVNLSSVPLLTFPILSAKHGAVKTSTILAKASKTAINAWETDPQYKVLYDKLRDHGQLRHTLEREVLEGARQTSEEYKTTTAKWLSRLAWPISATERLNRAVTGITAFELAKADGQTDEQAAEYALKIVKDVNTSGMATTAPKWMQSNIGRVMWTFKSFIWQSTWVTAKAFVDSVKGESRADKIQATKQLLYMYGMSYAVGGMFGLPLFGAISTMVTMVIRAFDLFDEDEDEPFHARTFMRELGLSEILLKGPLNEYLNLEISSRAGIANGIGFREEPYEIEKYGYIPAMVLQFGGPMGSYIVDLGDALEQFATGEIGRGFERLSPAWLRNGIKSTRFLREGARTRDGRPIDTDISAWNLYMQALGFTPADVSSLYEARSLAKNYENKVLERRSDILLDRYIAVTTGDVETLDKVNKRIENFRMLHPRLMSSETLKRSYKSRRAAEREYISGIRFSTAFRDKLDPFFRTLENATYYGGIVA